MRHKFSPHLRDWYYTITITDSKNHGPVGCLETNRSSCTFWEQFCVSLCSSKMLPNSWIPRTPDSLPEPLPPKKLVIWDVTWVIATIWAGHQLTHIFGEHMGILQDLPTRNWHNPIIPSPCKSGIWDRVVWRYKNKGSSIPIKSF